MLWHTSEGARMDIATIEYYDNHAQKYIDQTSAISMQQTYDYFLPLISSGGHILDAGCGSCRDSAVFQSKGFRVTAFDASEALVNIAQSRFTFPVYCETFDSFTTTEKYDGIWASASLLHLQENDIHKTLVKLKGMLKLNGIFYCSFKVGLRSRTDGKGRFFTDMTPTILNKHLQRLFNDVTIFTSQGSEDEMWCNGIGK